MARSFNIYSQRQRWKLLLFLVALVIVGVSLAYTKTLVDKIALEERTKVEIWSEAVKKRSALVHYTSRLFDKLQAGERKKVELYLEATNYLARPDISDVSFALNVLNDNTTVPVILTNEKGVITSHRNIIIPKGENVKAFLEQELESMASQYEPIEIVYYGNAKVYLYYRDSRLFAELKTTFDDLQQSFISELMLNAASSPLILLDSASGKVIEAGNVEQRVVANPFLLKDRLASMRAQHDPISVEINGRTAYVYYEDSYLLTQLTYYPLAQFGVIGLFMMIAYLLFSTARKAEQNQVWVGMSKETAHQLGTPLSSMLAWVELLREKEEGKAIADELEKDINRLQVVTERFSKIGSQPELVEQDLAPIIQEEVEYFEHRFGKKVDFELILPNYPIIVTLNSSLFEWVIENLIKNAIDAMDGIGKITVELVDLGHKAHLEVSDTGKGLANTQFKRVFDPGFTTKKRGWGLGLSLSKRIIKEYHSGKIYVLKSEIGKGTTFRISLRK
ncbi:MAG: ATP-binding protein [Bacteroidetes bacterium]|nr:ATP-binding protein [Bacteroidota bacterium]